MQATVLHVVPSTASECWDQLGFTPKAPADQDLKGLQKTKERYHTLMRELVYRKILYIFICLYNPP
jgi:hypothetical protein